MPPLGAKREDKTRQDDDDAGVPPRLFQTLVIPFPACFLLFMQTQTVKYTNEI